MRKQYVKHPKPKKGNCIIKWDETVSFFLSRIKFAKSDESHISS